MSEAIRWVRYLFGYGSFGAGLVESSWERDRHSRKNEGLSVWCYRQIIVVAVAHDHGKVGARSFLGITIYRDASIIGTINGKRFHRRFPLRLMHEVDPFGIP